jgi:type I restriction enzyme S subunit
MGLHLDKSQWKRVTLGEVAAASKEKVDPADGLVERYVAGEHMDTDDLKIHRWGDVGDVDLGPAFHRRFRPGQVLYGSRRTYLRKVAVADFDGVCANTTFVVETKDKKLLLQEFLPFVMSSEPFHEFSIAESKGSVNPYVNWSDMERYEFDLPSLDEQKRIGGLLWAAEREGRSRRELLAALRTVRLAHLDERMKAIAAAGGTVALETLIASNRPITYGILMPGSGHPGGVPVVKVKDFPDGYIDESDLLLTTPELALEYRRSTLMPGDLLISIRGTIGRLAEVPASLDGANITQDTARLSIAPEHDRQYVRLVLESDFVQAQIRRQTTGLAVKGLNLGALRKLEIPIPRGANDNEERALVRESALIDVGIVEAGQALAAAKTLCFSLLAEVFGGC